MVIFGKTANMGAMCDSYTEIFAKCIFKTAHEICSGSLTLHVNWFAGMFLKNVKDKKKSKMLTYLTFSLMAFSKNTQIHTPWLFLLW